ncbi:hypothetical protein GCM10025771_03130 [Niveibacterium umoris]|uniref:Cytochrome c n=1 Tax=Niveibacterium umoris TaxID=1193620 RepID=A0A840BLN4_9RHOO|nr:c-type cytochrome [Niveibacterium umoris]MBB4014145.1 cytochrome c [Niveibacterium umoris]
MKHLSVALAIVGLMSASAASAAVDADAAQALMKKSDCFKCHSIDKKKDGPPYREVARKYKGKADAEAALTKHITESPMVEIDGVKEEHKAIKSKDPAEIRNAVLWILSL